VCGPALVLCGHHERCKLGGPEQQVAALLDLVQQLARGIEKWAAEEDGVYDAAWKPYCTAKLLEGVVIGRSSDAMLAARKAGAR